MFLSRDDAVAHIREWNREFNGGARADKPRILNGISFWCVGRNASHEFYAGVGVDGKLYQRSFGEKLPDEDVEVDWNDFVPDYEERVEVVADFNGYYGHY